MSGHGWAWVGTCHAMCARGWARVRTCHAMGGHVCVGMGAIYKEIVGLFNGGSECDMDVKSTWIPTLFEMDHVSWSLGLFSNPPLGGRLDTKADDHGTPNAHNRRSNLLCHG